VQPKIRYNFAKTKLYKKMARVKIEIILSNGEQSIIEKEIADDLLHTFDDIEEFTTQIKREMLPDIQADLLKKSQSNFKKKKA
jgi:hypothetical protein